VRISNGAGVPLQRILLFIFFWIGLSVLTFQFKYYQIYLQDEWMLFGDLKGIMSCGGFNFLEIQKDDCSVFIYGTALLEAMSRLTALHHYGDVIAISIVVFGLAGFAWILANLNLWSMRVLVLALFLSPPIALLVQRANLDLLIFTVTVLAVELFRRNFQVLGIAALAATTLMKMYTLPLVLFFCIIYFFRLKTSRRKTFLVTFAVILTLWTVYDASQISWLPSDARNSFGLPIFGEYLQYAVYGSGSQSARWLANVIGCLTLAFLVAILYRYQVKRRSILIENLNFEALSWMILFMGIFLAGISVDYRLVFLIPIVVVFFQSPWNVRLFTQALLVPTFVFSYPFERLQVVGDVALFVLVALFVTVLLKEIVEGGKRGMFAANNFPLKFELN
jgi:hypothetical protein